MPPSPSITAIIDALATQIGTVSGVGVVHDHERGHYEPSEFLALMQDGSDDRIRVWFIEVEMLEDVEDDAGFLFLVPYRITIDGWMQWERKTTSPAKDQARQWRDLVERVESKVRANANVFGVPLITPPTISTFHEKAPLGDVLCFHSRIAVTVEAEETKT